MHSRKRDVTITVNGGSAQSGTVGATLGTSLSVNVKNYLGANYSGVQVEWLVNDDSFCTPSASLTDASGIASTDLTLGSAAGTVTVTARCGRQTVTITATKTAAGAAAIAAVTVTDQSASTSAAVAVPPSVQVTDAQGNPVSGQAITWAVTAGGGSVNTTGGTTTNASGIATLTSWTLGASAGLNTVTATAAGLSGSPVTFNANAVSNAPTQIAVTSGGSQTGVTAGSAATATQFTVRDAGNTAVQGVTVSFAVTGGSGSLSAASAVTNASGQASVTYTTYATVETATITGSFTNAGGAVVSASTTIASAAGAKTKLALQTEPSSSGTSGVALTQQPIVLIQDANSNTVLTATDTITAAVQSGNATISGNTKAAVAGVATFTGLTLVDTDGGVNVLHFSTGALTTVDSSGTTLAPPIAAGLQFGVQPGNVTQGASALSCSVYVVDAGGGAVPGATNAVTIAVTGGGATLTGTTTVNAVAGVATFASIAVGTAGTFTLTATASGLTSAVSASFTASAASAAYGFDPAADGMTNIVNRNFNTKAAGAGDRGTGSFPDKVGGSEGWDDVERNYANLSVTTDSTAPFSPSNVWRTRYTTSQAANSAPGTAQSQNFTAAVHGFKQYQRWYNRVGLKLSSNYQVNATNNKLWFHRATQLNGATSRTEPYLLLYNSSGFQLGVNFQGSPDNARNFGNGANGRYLSTQRLTPDRWYIIETYLKMDTSPLAGDGVFRCWVDSVLVIDLTDVKLLWTTGNYWDQFHLNSTWGGPGSPSSEFYFWVDAAYCWGRA